jgi:predicted DNA-binding protein (MmcQ/YjbR family)
MTLDQYDAYCASLPHTTHVVQWGGAHVWKVGGKVFAVGGWQDEGQPLFVTFKCSPMSYELLKDTQGCRPAPYLASRGMPWIQRTSAASLKDAALRGYIRESHRLAGLNLTKKVRKELGLE